jgi:hypothetical protein
MFSIRNVTYFIMFCLLLSPVMVSIAGLQQFSYSQQNTNEFVINNVSDNVGDSVYPLVASSDNNVYVTWQDNMFGHNKHLNYDILFKSSSDGGRTFGDILNLSNNSGFSEHPQISVNGNNVYVVWADNTQLNRDIYLTSSSDGGRTFGDVLNLSNNTADSHNQEIAVFGNNVYAVWQDTQKDQNGNSGISFTSSSDGGRTFGDVLNLSTNAGKSSFPKVSAFENNVYVAWNLDRGDTASTMHDNKDGVFFTKSTDNGNSFSKETSLNLGENPGETQIAANDNNVYVVWGSPGPSVGQNSNGIKNGNHKDVGNGVFFTKSIDNGNNFASPIFIKEQFQSSDNVEMIAHSDELIIAVQGSVNEPRGNQDIFLMKSLDRGNTFSGAVNISNNAGVSECPSIAISLGNDIFLTWQDNTPGNNDVLSTKISL